MYEATSQCGKASRETSLVKERKTKMTEMDEVQDRNGRIQQKEHSRTSTQEDSRTEAKRK